MINMNSIVERKGIFLSGIIIGRSKRYVGESNTEIVTYRINDGSTIHFIDHWEPESYYELGCEVSIPITVKAYIKNNNAYIVYTVKRTTSIGEDF